MVKIVMVCFFLVFQFFMNAQSVYLKAAKNFTTFKYIRSDGVSSDDIQKGVGVDFELGYRSLLFYRDSRFSYEVGLTLNEYNALVGTDSNTITWKTNYLGIQNSFLYSFFNNDKYSISAKIGLNVSKIVYGKQAIDEVLYDIRKNDDFKTVLFQYAVGLDTKFNVSDQIFIGLGYSFLNSINQSRSSLSKFYIKTGQINAGIYFEIE
jgi:hypothetical protein